MWLFLCKIHKTILLKLVFVLKCLLFPEKDGSLDMSDSVWTCIIPFYNLILFHAPALEGQALHRTEDFALHVGVVPAEGVPLQS